MLEEIQKNSTNGKEQIAAVSDSINVLLDTQSRLEKMSAFERKFANLTVMLHDNVLKLKRNQSEADNTIAEQDIGLEHSRSENTQLKIQIRHMADQLRSKDHDIHALDKENGGLALAFEDLKAFNADQEV